MGELSQTAQERLTRLLGYLAVSGGAALVDERVHRTIAMVGEVDEVLYSKPGLVLTDIAGRYRLVVRVPGGLPDRAFSRRIERVADLLNRLFAGMQAPPHSAPPQAAPAHAVVFLPNRARIRH